MVESPLSTSAKAEVAENTGLFQTILRSVDMPIVICAACSKEISDTAPACPSCVEPNFATSTTSRSLGVLLWIGMLLMSLMLAWYTTKSITQDEIKSRVSYFLSLIDLNSDVIAAYMMIMPVVLIYLALSIVFLYLYFSACYIFASYAKEKERSFLLWMLGSIFLTPVFAPFLFFMRRSFLASFYAPFLALGFTFFYIPYKMLSSLNMLATKKNGEAQEEAPIFNDSFANLAEEKLTPLAAKKIARYTIAVLLNIFGIASLVGIPVVLIFDAFFIYQSCRQIPWSAIRILIKIFNILVIIVTLYATTIIVLLLNSLNS